MVLPIIIGIGVTIVAITTKSTIAAIHKFRHLTPAMIASLNNIRIDNPNSSVSKDPHNSHHAFLRARFPAAGFKEPMTEQEALLIMGIEGDDIINMDQKLLKQRYRKLMVANHPDHHGSQYLLQKINQAKDVLDRSYMFKRR